jgi:hypothetical protein
MNWLDVKDRKKKITQSILSNSIVFVGKGWSLSGIKDEVDQRVYISGTYLHNGYIVVHLPKIFRRGESLEKAIIYDD